MKNSINWFEIPVVDFDRAKTFYEALFAEELHIMDQSEMNIKWAFFPFEQEGVGGSIVKGDGYIPSENGPLIYLNGGYDLNVPLSRAEKAGAKIVLPKTSIGENGFMATFIDSEGNRIAIHSRN